jgi:catalase
MKRNPQTNLKDCNMYWDFMSLRPETIQHSLFLFSDRGIPDGYRHMHGFSVNTYKLISHENTAFFARFHFRVDIN